MAIAFRAIGAFGTALPYLTEKFPCGNHSVFQLRWSSSRNVGRFERSFAFPTSMQTALERVIDTVAMIFFRGSLGEVLLG